MQDRNIKQTRLTNWRRRTTFRMATFTLLNLALLIILSAILVNHFENEMRHSGPIRFIVYSLLNLMGFVIIMTAYSGYNLRNQQTANAELILNSSANLSRRITQLQVAAEIARDASDTFDIDRILNRAVTLVQERFGFYHAGIFLIDEDKEYAVLRAASGPTSTAMLKNKHSLRIGKEGVVGYVTEFGKARIAHDVDQDTKYYNNPELTQTRSEVAIPLKIGNRVIGALDVQSTKQNTFDEADIEILQTLADLLAVAIDKAHLHEEVQQYAQDLEKRVEERTQELTIERGQLRAILDSMGEGVIYINPNQQVEYVNESLAAVLGYSVESKQINTKLQDYIADNMKRIVPSILKDIEKNQVWRGEHMFVDDETDTSIHVGITCTAVFGTEDNRNKLQGIVTVLRDISKEKELQEQKMRFVANASHELRTPVTNFMTHLYLIRNQPAYFQKHLDTLTHIAKNMKRLVENLLDMSYFEHGAIELQKQNTLLQDMINSIITTQKPEAQNKNITIQTTFPDNPIVSFIDEDRMAQVVTNLVTNAIRYTPEGGHITVTLGTNDTHTFIGVKDNGRGIADEHIEQLFQPFFRTSEEKIGTGLGLSIAKTIVDQHNAELIVESTLDQGSYFQINIPHDL